jgi:hypothetical protein
MTTDSYRERLLAEVEAMQARKHALRAYLVAHLGQVAGLAAEAEIARNTNLKVLPDAIMLPWLYFELGLPPGYCLTKEQLTAVLEAELSGLESDRG